MGRAGTVRLRAMDGHAHGRLVAAPTVVRISLSQQCNRSVSSLSESGAPAGETQVWLSRGPTWHGGQVQARSVFRQNLWPSNRRRNQADPVCSGRYRTRARRPGTVA